MTEVYDKLWCGFNGMVGKKEVWMYYELQFEILTYISY